VRRSSLRACAGAGAALLAYASLAGAQRAVPAGPALRRPAADLDARGSVPHLALADTALTHRAPWWTPIASAVLPGSGQAVTRQTRAAGYLALELYTWVQYREARNDARRARSEYRRIAREEARKPCLGRCPDGDWDYYELLEKTQYVSSGRFDAIPGGPLDPETADSTYNGSIWNLARELYFGSRTMVQPGDPAYRRALDYYRSRAYGPEFAWSWRDAQGQQGVYRQAVVQWNRGNRAASTALSVALANRVFSLVDAYVTLRVQGGAGTQPSGFSATVPWSGIPILRRRAQ
jgi:hypothetical protein